MELMEFFPKCLEETCASRTVVLMLDSLDQLPADEGGRRLDWLPGKMPDDFYLIMSTLPGPEYECLPHLKVLKALLLLLRLVINVDKTWGNNSRDPINCSPLELEKPNIFTIN